MHLDYALDEKLRPTKDRVKESMFNILSDHVTDATCLDLFAGCGSLGFEAISRGAHWVDFVDIDNSFLKKNASKFKDNTNFSIHRASFYHYVKHCNKRYDLIFLDPPWTQLHFFEDSLKLIFEFDILSERSIIVCEHPKDYDISTEFEQDTRSFGRSKLTVINHDKKSNLSG